MNRSGSRESGSTVNWDRGVADDRPRHATSRLPAAADTNAAYQLAAAGHLNRLARLNSLEKANCVAAQLA